MRFDQLKRRALITLLGGAVALRAVAVSKKAIEPASALIS
jgi:hypothetical protein